MTLKHLVTGAAKTRQDNLKLWLFYEDTIVEHLIKILIIDSSDHNLNDWQNEINNHLVKITKQNKIIKTGKSFYDEVREKLQQTNDSISLYTKEAVKAYLNNPSNLKHRALIRETSIIAIKETVESLLEIIIDYAELHRPIYIYKNPNTRLTISSFWDLHETKRVVKDIRELKSIIK